MSTGKRVTEIDRMVSERVRSRRQALGLSQTKLGDALGVTFQQVQKYEKGLNRISAGRIATIAEALGVGVEYFFQPVLRGQKLRKVA